MTIWKRHWFLISLLAALAGGMVFAQPLQPVAAMTWVSNLIVMVTLFVVTLPLETSQIQSACRRPGPALLATIVSAVIVPLAAWMCTPWMERSYAVGLMVCAAAPGTIASAAVWTRRAGGNEMVPILVTVITNLLCFLIVPFWMYVSAGQISIEISMPAMAGKLALLVVAPMVAGQAVRGVPRVADWARRRRRLLGIVAQVGILGIVVIGAVQCGNYVRTSGVTSELTLARLAILTLIVLGLNLFAFVVGQWLATLAGMVREDAIGVAFAGSQKTLMVGLHVALLMGGGLTILPIVIYHFLQLIVGTLLAERLRTKTRD